MVVAAVTAISLQATNTSRLQLSSFGCNHEKENIYFGVEPFVNTTGCVWQPCLSNAVMKFVHIKELPEKGSLFEMLSQGTAFNMFIFVLIKVITKVLAPGLR